MIGNLTNYGKFCTACDPTCSSCRFAQFNWSPNIKQAMIAPGPQDVVSLEHSGFTVAEKDAEVALLIDVHPEVMLEFAESLGDGRVRVVIVPVERPGIQQGLLRQLESILEDINIEFASPKPFCSLRPEDATPSVKIFIDQFGIGRPLIEIETKGGGSGGYMISKARVLRSAPCGATWFICRRLEGVEVDPAILAETISQAHHAYPCTASMSKDREIGDTFLHRAGYIARESVADAIYDHFLKRNMEDKGMTIRREMLDISIPTSC